MSVHFLPSYLMFLVPGVFILWPVPALCCFGVCFFYFFACLVFLALIVAPLALCNEFPLNTVHCRWICGKYVSASPRKLDRLLWYAHRKMMFFQISRKSYHDCVNEWVLRRLVKFVIILQPWYSESLEGMIDVLSLPEVRTHWTGASLALFVDVNCKFLDPGFQINDAPKNNKIHGSRFHTCQRWLHSFSITLSGFEPMIVTSSIFWTCSSSNRTASLLSSVALHRPHSLWSRTEERHLLMEGRASATEIYDIVNI